MNDKEKLEAIEKIINKKAEEIDDPPGARGTKLNKLLGGIKQSEYEKILKHTVTEFFDYVRDFVSYCLVIIIHLLLSPTFSKFHLCLGQNYHSLSTYV